MKADRHRLRRRPAQVIGAWHRKWRSLTTGFHGGRSFLEPLENRVLLSTHHPFELGDLALGNGTTGFVLNGSNSGDDSGRAVASAGDINGDGFDDLVIGAPKAHLATYESAGESYVVFGRPGGFPGQLQLSGLNKDTGFVIKAADSEGRVGTSVGSAGDVNGDGLDDLVIGAADAGDAGETYVVFGQAGGFDPTFELSALDGTNGFVIGGNELGETSGHAVSTAGDVNGDGFDDVLIGAPQAGATYSGAAGRAYVVFGQAGGFDAWLDLATLDGVQGFSLAPAGDDDYYAGNAVSNAGDINGDGFGDIVIGAHGQNQFAGTAYVVFGKPESFPAEISLATLDANDGLTITGIEAYTYAGASVSSAGDINGDGFDDIVIAAPYAQNNGASFVIFGHPNGGPSQVPLSSMNGTNGFEIRSGEYDYTGAVSEAGDINGDGFDDLIIGAPGGIISYADEGNKAYVLFGRPGPFAAVVEASDFDGTNGFVINGAPSGTRAGAAVSAAGDVDGDGFDDLVVGDPEADPNTLDAAGASYVIFGGDFTEAVTQSGDDRQDVLNGGAGPEVLVGGRGDDILAGGGGADILRGGEGDDVLGVSDTTFQRLAGGRGFDTLRLDGSDLHLDLIAISDRRMTGIEKIDITGHHRNILTLDGLEVLNISNSSNTLIVTGDSDDAVNIGPGWTVVGSELIGPTQFTVYQQGAAILKVFEVAPPVVPGDVDRDGNANNLDITPFIIALQIGGAVDDPDQVNAFLAQMPGGSFASADASIDGLINNLDITPFINLLAQSAGTAHASHAPASLHQTGPPAAILAAAAVRRPPSPRLARHTHEAGSTEPSQTIASASILDDL